MDNIRTYSLVLVYMSCPSLCEMSAYKDIPEISWLSKFTCIPPAIVPFPSQSLSRTSIQHTIPHSRASAYNSCLIRIDSQLAIGMPARHHQSSSPFALALHTDSRPPSSSLQTTSNTVRKFGNVRNEGLVTVIICFPLHGKVLALCSRMKLNACSSLRIQMVLEKCDNLSMLR